MSELIQALEKNNEKHEAQRQQRRQEYYAEQQRVFLPYGTFVRPLGCQVVLVAGQTCQVCTWPTGLTQTQCY